MLSLCNNNYILTVKETLQCEKSKDWFDKVEISKKL